MADANGNSPASAALAALGFAVFVRAESGALRLAGATPDWLRSLWPSTATANAELPVAEASPFFENFLIDAAEAWNAGAGTRTQSGPWIETAADGTELTLEATALTAGDQPILLLERLGETFEAKKSILQKARETVIAYQRLNSETQKKEILLNCIAEEMNSALANVITSLRLLELELSPPRTQQLVGLASRAADQQQLLINKILSVFAAELEGLHASGSSASDLAAALHAASEELAPQFEEKRVRFVGPASAEPVSPVAMDADHLQRLLAALLENALQNSPAGSTVQVDVADEAEAVRIQVCDEGPLLPPDLAEGMFSKTAVATPATETLLLRLQFCRVAVENCGGEIGYDPRGDEGNCFWMCLPKAAAES